MNNPDYLPFWLAAIALAIVPLAHWLLLHRPVAVSGRYTALVDRVRHGYAPPEPAMSEADMLAALRAMTAEEFGADAIQETAAPEPQAAPAATAPRAPDGPGTHLLFLLGLTAGGAASMIAGPGLHPAFALRSELFQTFFGGSGLTTGLVLFGGGLLVGVGTRMAGGCTSGHGLCGLSQLQSGSLVATMCFFGTGVLTSFVLGALG